MGCTFCKLYEIGDFFYENSKFFARYDRYPVTPGHAEIIPNRHVESINDLVKEEWDVLKGTIPMVQFLIENDDLGLTYGEFLKDPLDDKSAEFLQDALRFTDFAPAGYNVGINEGIVAGRTVHHLHIHIIPRYQGDVKDPIGGVRHIIPGKGNYK